MIQRILQLTDLHVFAEPEAKLKGIPTRESLSDVLNHIESVESPFDYVIITGDHTHDELPESYQAVRDLLTPHIDRLHQVPGNHDDRAVLNEVFGDRTGSIGASPIRFSIAADQWRLIGLDTHWPGEVAGMFDGNQADWLRSELDRCEQAHVALFFHHPPISVNSTWMDAIGLHGREQLADIASDDDRIQLICCGHVHHEFEGTLGNATVLTTPATGIQFDPSGAEPNFAADAPGYRIIELDGGSFRTEVRRLPETRYVPE